VIGSTKHSFFFGVCEPNRNWKTFSGDVIDVREIGVLEGRGAVTVCADVESSKDEIFEFAGGKWN
jgi:hypothetical protein